MERNEDEDEVGMCRSRLLETDDEVGNGIGVCQFVMMK